MTKNATQSPSAAPRLHRAVLVTFAAATLLALAAVPANAAPPFFTQFGEGGSFSERGDAGHTDIPRGIAANPANGRVFVVDQVNNRVDEFSAWGIFVKAWGWDVSPEGAPGDTPADELEICTTVCQAGILGAGAGQLSSPQGIAIDSAGDLYVVDRRNSRVQKFDPEGNFLRMWGKGVNTGTSGAPDLCTNAGPPTDVCGAGEQGAGPGQFGAWGVLGDYIDVGPGDQVYVGDHERIQRFDTEGVYSGEIALPGERLRSLATDPAGNLYAAFCAPEGTCSAISPENSKPEVRKLSPTGEELATLEFVNPQALATDPAGNLYVADGKLFGVSNDVVIRKLDSAGAEVEDAEYPFADGFDLTHGIALNPVTEAGDLALYISNSQQANGYIRAYGATPDPVIVGPPPSVPPTIVDQGATFVSFTEATLQVKINPHFWEDTTYFVQYGTVACIDAGGWEGACVSEQPASPAPLDAGVTDSAVTRSLDLDGLAPDTAYRFRFQAQSGGGGPVTSDEVSFTTFRVPANNPACPNQPFRNGPAAKLPDCRAYELVSPPDKNGGDILVYGYEGFDAGNQFLGLDQATPGGSRLAYSSASTFAGALGAPKVSQYIASRHPDGWATQPLNPPMRGGIANDVTAADSQFKAFSEDLCTGWLVSESGLPLAPGPTEGFMNLYRRDNCDGSSPYAWLGSSAPEPEPCAISECTRPYTSPELQGYTADGSHAVFRVNDALTPEAPRGIGGGGASGISALQTYLWTEGEGVRLVSRLPDGAPFAGTSTVGTALASVSPAEFGKGRTSTVENALSEDGSRVYWTTTDGPGAGRLYLRLNADQSQSAVSGGQCTQPARACTLPVSEAVPTDQPAQFWFASPDGSRAIFSILGSGSLAGNLYRYDLSTREATLLAQDTLGLAGATEDLSRLYFASREICSGAKENSEGDVAEAGKPNLYLREAGQSCVAGELDFVGALVEEDVSTGGQFGRPSPLASVPRDRIARATPDGGHLTFVSAAQLTAYDNADAASGSPDREVYVYDAEEGDLACASCNPTGARPHGADLSNGGDPLWTAAWIPGYQHQFYGRRPLSEDGRRLFFNVIEPLVPQDINDAQDVYQWEAPGSGDCTTASSTYSTQNEGCVSLISSGESPQDSEFVDASASGDDVFIRTASSLDPRDPGFLDIYDARVNGGIPLPADPAACEGEACQSPPAPPDEPTPASAAFRGAGNVKQAPRSCRPAARRAKRLSRKAKRARRASKRARAPKRTKALGRRAKRSAKQARRHSKRAKRCRAARKRANANRRAAR